MEVYGYTMKIEKITIVIGALLILLGFAFFVATGLSKYTTLIPLPLGILLTLSGWVARSEKWRKAVMHVASLLGLLGSAPFFIGLPKLIAYVQGQNVQRPLAAIEMTCMGAVCLVYFILCLKYFIDRQLEKRRSK